ncbi:PREDICTED: cholesterol 7-desaturase [Polistes dominula]|uniref:cholesterol 7-desaturase n=1 Tax=Polistes dominula TaxID=743375 RepID=A0ABM1ILT1_POLDO|nr:PREDICTED: cholesterol 7-desaturase [Polistes dominula]
MIFGLYSVLLATLLAFLIYIAFFWKINWVRDYRCQKKIKHRRMEKLPPVYPNGWFALLESSQLKVGEVKHVSALGENFAVFRTEKGIVKILDAYCPHLGANMGEGGRVRGECLECPFHKWLFCGDNGRCLDIPYTEKVPNFVKTKSWRCCEVNKIIFVWYHAESATPDWQPQSHEKISNGSWRFQGRNEFIINCHIQDIAENGADMAHLSAVHGPALFLSEDVMRLVRHTWSNASWTPQTSVSKDESSEEMSMNKNNPEDDETKNHRANMTLRHSLLLFDRFDILELNVKVEQIGPGYVELLIETTFGNMFIIQTVTPIEPLLQRICHIIFSPPLLAPYASIVFLGECLMFERDVAIWNHKRFETRPMLVKEDKTISTYRKWYAQFYSANSPTYQTATKSLQW